MRRIAAIARNPINSPNMTANDAAILESVTAELTARGEEVTMLGEEENISNGIQAVCTMSRTESTLKRLKAAEAQGVCVINSTTAIENCSRARFMEILHSNSIPQPRFKTITDAAELLEDCFPCWIKKACGWSCHKEDVCFAATEEEAIDAMERMAMRGISEYIQMQHCPGDIVKFYGIGEYFFRHCYPGNTKFGYEEINGAPQNHSFDETVLKGIAQKAAKAIGLDIYGGDAIVTANGDIYIIDINDFPSFTAIRSEAAKEIAELIIGKTKQRYER